MSENNKERIQDIWFFLENFTVESWLKQLVFVLSSTFLRFVCLGFNAIKVMSSRSVTLPYTVPGQA